MRSGNEDPCVDWSMKKRDYLYMRWYPLQGGVTGNRDSSRQLEQVTSN
jgi:hypothetical protein